MKSNSYNVGFKL